MALLMANLWVEQRLYYLTIYLFLRAASLLQLEFSVGAYVLSTVHICLIHPDPPHISFEFMHATCSLSFAELSHQSEVCFTSNFECYKYARISLLFRRKKRLFFFPAKTEFHRKYVTDSCLYSKLLLNA